MPVLNCPIAREDWIQEIDERNGVSVLPTTRLAEKPVEEAGPWEPAVQKILEFERLGNDWDGFGAKAPARDVLESAVGLAYLFYEKGVEPPARVAPGVDGSITFEWQFPNGTYADVEIIRPLYAEVMLLEPGQPAKHWTLPTQ